MVTEENVSIMREDQRRMYEWDNVIGE